jgi:hypothetical protein
VESEGKRRAAHGRAAVGGPKLVHCNGIFC